MPSKLQRAKVSCGAFAVILENFRELGASVVTIRSSGFRRSFDALNQVIYIKRFSEQARGTRSSRLGLQIGV